MSQRHGPNQEPLQIGGQPDSSPATADSGAAPIDHRSHGGHGSEAQAGHTLEHQGSAPGPAAHGPGMDHSAHGQMPREAHTAAEHHGAHGPDRGVHPGQGVSIHATHNIEMFQRRFWVCLVLTLPVLLYAEPLQLLLGFTSPQFPGADWLPLVLSSIIYFYGGAVFLQGSVWEAAQRRPGMMTLIAMAITVAYAYSVAAELFRLGMPLYWELDTLIVIMLLGHWMEMKAISGASGALTELAKLLPDVAEVVVDGRVQEVRVDQLQPGQLVLVRPGARVPADGEVAEGESSVDEAVITGESRPVSKQPGSRVIAGTVNGEGSLRVRLDRVGGETALAGIMRLVEEAQNSRSRAQTLADRAAFYLTVIAIVTGALTAVVWLAANAPESFALERTVTVLVIACPHALGLAIPLVIAISTTLAARSGLLVRDRLALEKAREVNAVIFDKTGTLTRGEQALAGVAIADGMLEDEALALAAAVEGDSEHMIARAIRTAASSRRLRLPAVTGFQAISGKGAQAQIDGRTVQVGGPRLLEAAGASLPAPLQQAATEWGAEGKTVVYLLEESKPRAAFALADAIRPESVEAVRGLQRMGVRVAMLTGDSEDVARTVARELGIDEYFAEVLPENKAAQVRALQQRGLAVAMVGDGVNDAPALATADVGIAIGAGTDVAIESAGIILVRSDPRDIARIIKLSQASYRKMLQNLFWATGYNVIAIPLAAGVLAPFGIVLAPAVGALFMSASTVIVALNAQLLRRLDLQQV